MNAHRTIRILTALVVSLTAALAGGASYRAF
jgi:hypothetical protein